MSAVSACERRAERGGAVGRAVERAGGTGRGDAPPQCAQSERSAMGAGGQRGGRERDLARARASRHARDTQAIQCRRRRTAGATRHIARLQQSPSQRSAPVPRSDAISSDHSPFLTRSSAAETLGLVLFAASCSFLSDQICARDPMGESAGTERGVGSGGAERAEHGRRGVGGRWCRGGDGWGVALVARGRCRRGWVACRRVRAARASESEAEAGWRQHLALPRRGDVP
jgi:hypothetical protein